MHKEYAVQPTAIAQSWDRFRYLIEKFGFSEGRLISQFPKTWPKLVLEAAERAGVSPVAKKKIEVALTIRRQLVCVRTGRNYDPALGDWIANAVASHETRAFDGILVNADPLPDGCISAEDVDETNPSFRSPKSSDIPRTSQAISVACSRLLSASREIDLVDPFFDLRPNVGNDYVGPLTAILADLALRGGAAPVIRIHFRDHDGRPSEELILRNAARWTENVLPPGFQLHLFAWATHADGEQFHDRFVLTERGGIQFGAGLGAARGRQSVAVTLLDFKHATEMRSRFAENSKIYQKVGPTIRIQSDGRVERLAG